MEGEAAARWGRGAQGLEGGRTCGLWPEVPAGRGRSFLPPSVRPSFVTLPGRSLQNSVDAVPGAWRGERATRGQRCVRGP